MCSRFSVTAPVRFAGMLTTQCDMQQLTFHFEGYADSRQPVDAGTARQCKGSVSYKAFQHFFVGLQKSVTKPSSKIFIGMCSLPDLLRASLCVAFAFGMMFFAAIIGG